MTVITYLKRVQNLKIYVRKCQLCLSVHSWLGLSILYSHSEIYNNIIPQIQIVQSESLVCAT
jgi:hypothetical protein